MERLEAFELMLYDIQKQSEFERNQMEKLKIICMEEHYGRIIKVT